MLGYDVSKEDCEGALAAILLHDIGHAPFSHVLEHSLVSNISHEEISLLMMLQINKEEKGRLDNALKIFLGTHPHAQSQAVARLAFDSQVERLRIAAHYGDGA